MKMNNSDTRKFLETMKVILKKNVQDYILAENKFVKQFDIDILLQNIDIALDNYDEELFMKLTEEMKRIDI